MLVGGIVGEQKRTVTHRFGREAASRAEFLQITATKSAEEMVSDRWGQPCMAEIRIRFRCAHY